MFNWLKDLIQTQKKVVDNMSSDQYKLRIKTTQLYVIIATIIFVPALLYFFFAGYVFSGFLMLALLLGIYAMAYFGIKSLRRNYEIAILKEKIKQNKEKRNKEREKKDENEEEK